MVWDLVALACLIHPEWFLPNHVSINYVTSAKGAPRIIETAELNTLASVNIPEFEGAQDVFWNWVFERL